MPKEGMNRDEYLSKKFGGREQALKIYQNIENEGKLANIYFQFKKIKITPNSFLSHKLLAFAFNKQQQNKVLETIFFHYFIEGKNIGNLEIIIEIAKQSNLYEEGIEKYLLSEKDNENLLNEAKQASDIGVSGVPCFIFNKEFVVNGAQPTENFINIINSLKINE
tara:strand:- start:335 stop:829 length:495 start_codon:yes stop_codon:yes gene_type:complete